MIILGMPASYSRNSFFNNRNLNTMKRQTILLLVFFFLFLGKYANGQDCPVGNVTITNQAEADAFGLQYPNCTQISGDFRVSGSGTSPDLPNLERVTGKFSFSFSNHISGLPISARQVSYFLL